MAVGARAPSVAVVNRTMDDMDGSLARCDASSMAQSDCQGTCGATTDKTCTGCGKSLCATCIKNGKNHNKDCVHYEDKKK